MKTARALIFSLFALCFCISSMGAVGYEELCFSDLGLSLETSDNHHDDCHSHSEHACSTEAPSHTHCLDLKLSDNDLLLSGIIKESKKLSSAFYFFCPAPLAVDEFPENEALFRFSGLSPPILSPHPFLTTVRLLL
jgi:hypothetical protein